MNIFPLGEQDEKSLFWLITLVIQMVPLVCAVLLDKDTLAKMSWPNATLTLSWPQYIQKTHG